MARPCKVSDDVVLSVIHELRASRSPSTGVDIRRALQNRLGVRAGTDRIYRLLRHAPMTVSPVIAGPQVRGDSDRLARERDEALNRARLAEQREEATQDRTALEIDTLRQALRSLGVDPFTMEPLGSKPFKV